MDKKHTSVPVQQTVFSEVQATVDAGVYDILMKSGILGDVLHYANKQCKIRYELIEDSIILRGSEAGVHEAGQFILQRYTHIVTATVSANDTETPMDVDVDLGNINGEAAAKSEPTETKNVETVHKMNDVGHQNQREAAGTSGYTTHEASPHEVIPKGKNRKLDKRDEESGPVGAEGGKEETKQTDSEGAPVSSKPFGQSITRASTSETGHRNTDGVRMGDDLVEGIRARNLPHSNPQSHEPSTSREDNEESDDARNPPVASKNPPVTGEVARGASGLEEGTLNPGGAEELRTSDNEDEYHSASEDKNKDGKASNEGSSEWEDWITDDESDDDDDTASVGGTKMLFNEVNKEVILKLEQHKWHYLSDLHATDLEKIAVDHDIQLIAKGSESFMVLVHPRGKQSFSAIKQAARVVMKLYQSRTSSVIRYKMKMSIPDEKSVKDALGRFTDRWPEAMLKISDKGIDVICPATHLESIVKDVWKLLERSRSTNPANTDSFRWMSQPPSNALVVTPRAGPRICVYVTDITQMPVNAIVNATNPQLHNNVGVAKAISRAAGRDYDQECNTYRRRHGMLPFHGVVVTGSGQLPCKKVFHTFGPAWNRVLHQTCLDEMEKKFYDCLVEAQSQRMASIAIPAISCGLNGGPPDQVAECAASAIVQYLDTYDSKTSLREIHLVDINETIVRSFQVKIQDMAESRKMQTNKSLSERREMKSRARATPPSRLSATLSAPSASSLYSDVAKLLGHTGFIGQGAGIQGRGSRSNPRVGTATRSTAAASAKAPIPGLPRQDSSTKGDSKATGPKPRRKGRGKGKSGNKAKSPPAASPRETKKVSDKEEKEGDDNDDCPICMCPIDPNERKVLPKCKHAFCRDCIDECFDKTKPACPICGTMYGKMTGNQPDGHMVVNVDRNMRLPGFEKYGTIMITYTFPAGTQTDKHPHPGSFYPATQRHAYLPDNKEGRKVLKLLEKAWEAKMVFTIGRSVTTGRDDRITWNDIHHKTSVHGGPSKYVLAYLDFL